MNLTLIFHQKEHSQPHSSVILNPMNSPTHYHSIIQDGEICVGIFLITLYLTSNLFLELFLFLYYLSTSLCLSHSISLSFTCTCVHGCLCAYIQTE